MILTDLLDLPVHADGQRAGYVSDARFELTGTSLATARLIGLVISPHRHTSTLGFERTGIRSPALIARFQCWRHRGTFLVLWEDVSSAGPDKVTLHPHYRRYSSRLSD
jgi:hypothetical protein